MESLDDDPWSERHKAATIKENIDRIHHTVMNDSGLAINQIVIAIHKKWNHATDNDYVIKLILHC